MQGFIFPPALLPGGRWLLSVHGDGRLLATDLDAGALEPQPLIEAEQFIEGSNISDLPDAFEVWVDPKAAHLSCRIVLCKLGPTPELDGGTTRTRFHIYQVRLEGHGSGTRLVSEPYQVFEGPYPGRIMTLALDDRHFIHSRNCGEHDNFWGDHYAVIHIFSFPMSPASDMTPITMNMDDDLHTISDTYILPHKRFVILGQNSVRIYAIPITAQISGSRVAPLQTIKLMLMPTQMARAVRSPLYVGPHSTTIVYAAKKAIIALQIPHDATEALRMIDLGEHLFYYHFKQCVRLSRTVFVWRNGGPFFNLGIMDHDWSPSDDGSSNGHFAFCAATILDLVA
ncbi:hypothetical protein P691DRAFT_765032 [Macrolepiota fuliginosa MF-IS2]|uniref:Uncharacterized protein n=1 Tax=Macrolepiota fuliginosa MF-IS2 TaxID=1400762 RepID=A0A9P5X182_9AGAR|nr:hypothetical protein P691DRAFT_765032 [Macrolepiota fuliginosa MF-IS2]